MKTTNYAGIDYSLGQSNVDRETGIHFGVISQHSVGEAWYEDAEADYGKPHCPECGNEIKESKRDKDYRCGKCRKSFWSDQCFGDDPIGCSFEDKNYKLSDCLDSDIFVLKSPFYTYAQFCSPCVPGAGNLDNPCEPDSGAPKTYCLGADWFEDGKAPYRIWNVSDNSEVTPNLTKP